MVLSVLFSLTFEKALEHSLGGVTNYHTTWQINNAFVASPSKYFFQLLQLLAFLLTLFRFYAGAYRFNAQAPRSTTLWAVVWNLTNTTLLFVGFYVAALLVPTRGMFALFVALFHVIDLGWFGLGGPLVRGDPALERAKDYFVLFDVITVVGFAVIGIWWWVDRFDTKWVQLLTSVLLIMMFSLDVLFKCRDFYFNPNRWIKASTEMKASTSSGETAAVKPNRVVYFAGPLFTQGERSWNAKVVSGLRAAGFDVLLPQEQAQAIVKSTGGLTPEERATLFRIAIESVDRADLVIAILDGPDADSGTSFECGYAFAKNTPVLGIRTDLRFGGDDKDRAANLMLSESCRRFMWIGLDSLAKDDSAVGADIRNAAEELLAQPS